MSAAPSGQNVHGTVVALDADRGVLLIGPSGSGKSSMALRLMALGARLVSDDRTDLRQENGALVASAPAAIAGRIEARGIGILAADALPFAKVVLVVDMSRAEVDRLPAERVTELCGVRVPLVLQVQKPHFGPAILQYLKAGRVA